METEPVEFNQGAMEEDSEDTAVLDSTCVLVEDIGGMILFVAVLIMYSCTAYPSVAGGDSGELITASALGGVAHPPGYPLYTLLTAGFIYILEGTGLGVAGRANQLSCLFGALAALLMYRALVTWFRRSCSPEQGGGFLRGACALTGVVMFSVSPTVWHTSTHAEVFALNNALCALLLLLLARTSPWRETRSPISEGPVHGRGTQEHSIGEVTKDKSKFGALAEGSGMPEKGIRQMGTCLGRDHMSQSRQNMSQASQARQKQENSKPECQAKIGAKEKDGDCMSLYLGALVSGLCLANQHTSLLLVLPACAAVLVELGWDVVQHILQLVSLGLLGLLPYLHLHMAAVRNPEASWGGGGCSTWIGLFRHMSRDDYGTFQLASSGAAHIDGLRGHGARSWTWLHDFSSETYGLGPACVLWGLRDAVGRGGVGCALAACLVLHLVVFLGMANVNVEDALARYVLSRFHPQAHLCAFSIMACFLRQAIFSTCQIFNNILAFEGPESLLCRSAKRRKGWLWLVIAVLLSITVAGTRYKASDQSSNNVVRSYALSVLTRLPRGAVLVTQGDAVMYSTRYLMQVEGIRNDIHLIAADMIPGLWYRQFSLSPQLGGGLDGWATDTDSSLSSILFGFLQREGWSLGVFVAPDLKNSHFGLAGAFHLCPMGVVKRVVPNFISQSNISMEGWTCNMAVDLQPVEVLETPLEAYFWKDGWERSVLSYHWHLQLSMGVTALRILSNRALADSSNLFVALERMDNIGRQFGWYFYNCDLPRNMGLTYALLAHQSQQLTGQQQREDEVQQSKLDNQYFKSSNVASLARANVEELLRARDRALSVYVNCPGAEAVIVKAAQKVLMGHLSHVAMQFV